jgi:ABC-type lipoprotein export system ATPase subunit
MWIFNKANYIKVMGLIVTSPYSLYKGIVNLCIFIKILPFWQPKQLFLIGSILISYFLLETQLWNLFDDFVVTNFLGKLTRTAFPVLIDAIYLLMLSYICYIFYDPIIKKGYKISLVTFSLIFCICLLYWIKRLGQNHYIFNPLFNQKFTQICIYQTDPAFIVLTLLTITLFINYFRFLDYKPVPSLLLQDQPINRIENDTFNRKQFFLDLLVHIRDLSFNEKKGFAIGINGFWGIGKSSFLEIIKEDLKNDSSIVCVDYNPWLSANKQSLTYDFFLLLENELSKHIESPNLISKYGAKVSKIDDERNLLKKISELFSNEKSLKKTFDNISRIIKRTNKKIFIAIDDIDRLDNKEVLEVLRLIRNTANFPRINFIVAYHKEYLIEALCVNKIHLPEHYLEKIFDLEIPLPKIESKIILEDLNSILIEGLKKIQFNKIDDKQKEFFLKSIQDQVVSIIFSENIVDRTKNSIVKPLLLEIFSSKRNILKFTNSFLLMYSLNYSFVYLPDFFILELIKMTDNNTYNLIAKNDKYLYEVTQLEQNEQLSYELFENNNETNNDKDSKRNNFRGNLFNIMDKIKNERSKNLLQALFLKPKTRDYQFEKAISYIDNFESYFTNTLTSTSIEAIKLILRYDGK